MADIVRMVLGYLWEWIYRSGITQQQVIDFFTSFDPRAWLRSRKAANPLPTIPDEIKTAVAKLLVMTGWNMGQFALELEKQIRHPPPGFRWRTDKWGNSVLVEEGVAGEQPIVKRKGFADHVFIGIWWHTAAPRGAANQELQRFIRANGGKTFWRPKRLYDGFKQYGAYIITTQTDATAVADALCALMPEVEAEGGGEYRLSAIKMDGIAEHREVRRSDQFWAGCIRSIKLNWEYNLDDLLNGRIGEFKQSKVYTDLIAELRQA